jgi:2-iminoacetate synthase ThiH
MDDKRMLTEEELERMLDRAAKRGARAALAEIGLHDEQASKDIGDLRDLMVSWRETRRAAWTTTVKIVTTSLLLFIAGAVWLSVKSNLTGE